MTAPAVPAHSWVKYSEMHGQQAARTGRRRGARWRFGSGLQWARRCSAAWRPGGLRSCLFLESQAPSLPRRLATGRTCRRGRALPYAGGWFPSGRTGVEQKNAHHMFASPCRRPAWLGLHAMAAAGDVRPNKDSAKPLSAATAGSRLPSSSKGRLAHVRISVNGCQVRTLRRWSGLCFMPN